MVVDLRVTFLVVGFALTVAVGVGLMVFGARNMVRGTRPSTGDAVAGSVADSNSLWGVMRGPVDALLVLIGLALAFQGILWIFIVAVR